MSLFVVAVGLSHGIPAAIVGMATRSRIVVALASLAMVYVAIEFGGNQYVGFDIIGVCLGAFLGWHIANHALQPIKKTVAAPQEIVETPQLEADLDVIHDQMWSEMIRNGASKGLSSAQIEKRREVFGYLFTQFIAPDMTDELLSEDDWIELGYLLKSIGKTHRDLFEDYLQRRVGNSTRGKEAIQRAMDNYDAAFKAERELALAKKLLIS